MFQHNNSTKEKLIIINKTMNNYRDKFYISRKSSDSFIFGVNIWEQTQ